MRALLALAAVLFLATGVATATPVPVVSVSDGTREFLGVLRDGEHLVYSYRQSVYEVTVGEEFARQGDRLDFLRVTAGDIRAIEYLRWDTEIRMDDGRYIADAPPTDTEDLVIRISAGAEQRLRSGGWSFILRDRFGDGVVRVRLERPGVLLAMLRGLAW